MIYDKIENVNKYAEIPKEVKDFIEELDFDIQPGRYEITDKIYANVDVYNTKHIDKCRLEAHKKYTDIQLLLFGEERLDFTDIDGLITSQEYSAEKDIMFFQTPIKKLNSLRLYRGVFAMLYPHEAHMPQVNLTSVSQSVKKVVIKFISC